MKVQFLKLPEGMYKRAYTLGGRRMLLDIIFWYRLKAESSDGFFRSGSIGRLDLKESQNVVYERVSRLSDYGLISVGKSGFTLAKYDTLFELLEYDMGKRYRAGSFHRSGTFKIWKLNAKYIDDIIEYMMYFDIKLAITRQLFASNPKQQKLYERTTLRGKRMLDAEEHLGKAVVKQMSPMSGHTIAALFGYSTPSTGNKILHKLRELGFLKIERRIKVKDMHPQGAESKYNMLRRMKRGGRYRMKRGVLMEILSNGVSPLID